MGSTYNFAAPLYLRMIAAFESGDLANARTIQHQAVQLIEELFRYDPIAAGKTTMQFLGIDCGPARPPLRNLTASETEALEEALARLGVLESPKRQEPNKRD